MLAKYLSPGMESVDSEWLAGERNPARRPDFTRSRLSEPSLNMSGLKDDSRLFRRIDMSLVSL